MVLKGITKHMYHLIFTFKSPQNRQYFTIKWQTSFNLLCVRCESHFISWVSTEHEFKKENFTQFHLFISGFTFECFHVEFPRLLTRSKSEKLHILFISFFSSLRGTTALLQGTLVIRATWKTVCLEELCCSQEKIWDAAFLNYALKLCDTPPVDMREQLATYL